MFPAIILKSPGYLHFRGWSIQAHFQQIAGRAAVLVQRGFMLFQKLLAGRRLGLDSMEHAVCPMLFGVLATDGPNDINGRVRFNHHCGRPSLSHCSLLAVSNNILI